MKKFFCLLPRAFAIAALTIAFSCNSSPQNDNDADSTSSHNSAGDTSMTDPTRTATSGQGNDVTSAMSDTGFITKNIMDNMMEIHMSKMGRDKGTSPDVKKIATLMVADHTQMLADLKALAAKKGLPEHKDHAMDMSGMPDLTASNGQDFDMLWIAQMRAMHEAKIVELQNFLNTTQDADLKALANKALPKIKMHRDNLSKLKSGAQ